MGDSVVDEEITVYSDISNNFEAVKTTQVPVTYKSIELLRNAYPNYFIFNSVFFKKWKLTKPSIFNDGSLDVGGSSLFVSAAGLSDISVYDINFSNDEKIQQNNVRDLIFQDPSAVRVKNMSGNSPMEFLANKLRKKEEGWSFSTWVRFGEYNDLNNIITLRADTGDAFVKLLGVSNMLGRNSSITAVLLIKNDSGFYSFYLDDFFDIHGNWQMICIVIQWNGTISLYNNGELKGSEKIGNLPVGDLRVFVSGNDIIDLETDLGWKFPLDEFSSNILTNEIHCGEWDIVDGGVYTKKNTKTTIPLRESPEFDDDIMRWPPASIPMVPNNGFVFSAWVKDLSGESIDISTNTMILKIKKDDYDAVFLENNRALSIGYDFFREEGVWKHIGVIVDPSADREPTMLLNGNPAFTISEPGISDYHLTIHDPSELYFYDKDGWRYPYHWWKLTDISGEDIPDSGNRKNDIKMIYDLSNNQSGMVFEDSTYIDLGRGLSFGDTLWVSVDISFNRFPAPILYLANDNNSLNIFVDENSRLKVELKTGNSIVSKEENIITNVIIRLSVIITKNDSDMPILEVRTRSINDQKNNISYDPLGEFGTIQGITFDRCYI